MLSVEFFSKAFSLQCNLLKNIALDRQWLAPTYTTVLLLLLCVCVFVCVFFLFFECPNHDLCLCDLKSKIGKYYERGCSHGSLNINVNILDVQNLMVLG